MDDRYANGEAPQEAKPHGKTPLDVKEPFRYAL